MGEVYLAEDPRLGRKIALKILPPDFAQDEKRLRRFEQEARAVSTLNHPNILTIYEIGQDASVHFIATEFIEGETLRQRIVRSHMVMNEILDVAIQVATALAAAHAVGIVHRDIKPENIMLRSDGYVKVLDFGLSKLTGDLPGLAAVSDASTVPKIDTSSGAVMGTVSYMAPDQLRRLKLDARTDIWSLGVVLYEMVAGRAPFEGLSVSDVIASILERDPLPLARFFPDVPSELSRIVTKALRKDRDQRYQTAKDLLIDLKDLKQDLEFENQLRSGGKAYDEDKPATETEGSVIKSIGQQPDAGATSPIQYIKAKLHNHKTATSLVLVFLMLAAAFGSYRLIIKRGLSSLRRIPFHNPQAIRIPYTDKAIRIEVSPDGRIVYVSHTSGNADIWIMDADGSNQTQLSYDPNADRYPSPSRDGRYILFVSDRRGNNDVWRMDSDGRNIKQLTFGMDASSPSCSSDGQWVVYSGTNDWGKETLWKVPIEGGVPVQLTDRFVRLPIVSPDGKLIACAYWDEQAQRNKTAILPFEGGEFKKSFDIVPDKVRWAPDSQSLMYVDVRKDTKNIWSLPLNGNTPKRVTNFNELEIYSFDWSYDGKFLVCERGNKNTNAVIIRDSP